MPRPRKIDYPTYWSWKQADRQWVKAHGGRAIWPLLIAVVIGVLSGNAAVLLILLAVAVIGTAYARSR